MARPSPTQKLATIEQVKAFSMVPAVVFARERRVNSAQSDGRGGFARGGDPGVRLPPCPVASCRQRGRRSLHWLFRCCRPHRCASGCCCSAVPGPRTDCEPRDQLLQVVRQPVEILGGPRNLLRPLRRFPRHLRDCLDVMCDLLAGGRLFLACRSNLRHHIRYFLTHTYDLQQARAGLVRKRDTPL